MAQPTQNYFLFHICVHCIVFYSLVSSMRIFRHELRECAANSMSLNRWSFILCWKKKTIPGAFQLPQLFSEMCFDNENSVSVSIRRLKKTKFKKAIRKQKHTKRAVIHFANKRDFSANTANRLVRLIDDFKIHTNKTLYFIFCLPCHFHHHHSVEPFAPSFICTFIGFSAS